MGVELAEASCAGSYPPVSGLKARNCVSQACARILIGADSSTPIEEAQALHGARVRMSLYSKENTSMLASSIGC